jgi:2-polyprenyl-6-methoxyphenol hydroxylase-like FAD-dependent oxidoreductase
MSDAPTHGNPPADPRILIVGAGPTGLTLAIELARRGAPFRVIDKALERPTTSRALGTQPRTVEIFCLMGIPDSALRPAVRPRAFQFKEGERTLSRLLFAAGGTSGPAPPLIMDESDTERVLEERLAGYGGRVERGIELQTFRRDGERVIATVTGRDGAAEIGARFLVGADGAHSTVRREAGIAFTGSTYPERFLLADLDLDWAIPHDEGTVWFGDEAGVAAAIPLPAERRWRLIVALSAAASAEIEEEPAAIANRAEAALRARAGIPLRRIGAPIWASSFHIHRRLAARYRVGPIFLAGDAAHVHSPVGGQGMNTGIQDAFNLGWKLALASRALAAPGLLESYEAERRPVAEGVLRGTDLGTRLVLGANPVGRVIREYVFPVATDLPPIRDRLLATASELRIGYRRSPLSVDADERSQRTRWRRRGGLRAGDRVPDSALLDPSGVGERSLFELVARGWTLLLFPGSRASDAWLETLLRASRQVEEAVGDAVQPYLILTAPLPDEPAAPALLDPSGKLEGVLAARDGLVALVRPDGYLGYRGRPDQPGDLASYLARVFAMRIRDAGP